MQFKIELSKAYEPNEIEHAIYKFWEDYNLFNPDTQKQLGLVTDESPAYCLTLPPPNVTGVLHLGHALTVALEDLMTRYQRMLQKQTLFLPGSDHAGIATQNVVERELKKQGINRKDLGREKFIEKTWEWKQTYHARITEQSKRLGMSSDWSRERFTLDENLSKAVREAFYRLYQKKLIYRGNYLVNWCPGRCESAISDLEAELEEVQSKLWFIRYPVINESFTAPQGEWGSGQWAKGANTFIEVATTRPETLLGDTAVATHKKHKQFGKLIGKQVVLPVNNRKITIIADQHVDPKFGTGAVKVTPAHDPNDYEIGLRHKLEFITVMSESGSMLPEHSGKYANMDRYKARELLVKDLELEGLLVKIEDYTHSVAHCQRCSTIIEPRISTQWFVKTKTLAEAAMEKVKNKETVILPDREEKRFFQWMENIKDWCISRQLWWGHRIPVFYCPEGHQTCSIEDPTACEECGNTNLNQDEDVLDTWFSSGLWPFSTLGWPNINNPDFKKFFPTTMRETGYDILFFWVAREMMLGIELTGQTPYKTVYFHGIVRNENGKKISKSMENIEQYDPLKIISEHGSDSLRFTLISNAVPGLDINLDARQLDAAHKFCNKIWQSTKFALMQASENENIPPFDKKIYNKLHITDKWIISQLHKLIKETNQYMDNHEYLKVSRDIKNFFWNIFCDWYLESTKIRLYDEQNQDKEYTKIALFYVLESSLKLLHPIIPYITEVLWQALPDSIKIDKALIIAKWPQYDENLVNNEVDEQITISFELIREIRRIRTDFNIAPNISIPITINAGDLQKTFENTKDEIAILAKVDASKFFFSEIIPKNSARIVQQNYTAYLPLADVIDKEKEYLRISKHKDNLVKLVNSIEKKLSGPFAQKATSEVVEKEKEKMADYKSKLAQFEEQLEILK